MKAPFEPPLKFPIDREFSESLRALARKVAANPFKPESVGVENWAHQLAHQSCAADAIPENDRARQFVRAYFDGVVTAWELQTQLMFCMEHHEVEEMLALIPEECGTGFRESLATVPPEGHQYYHYGEMRDFSPVVIEKIRTWQSTLPKP